MRRLILIELAALTALLCVSGVMASYGFLTAMLGSNALFEPVDAAIFFFSYTAFFGVLPVVLIGAPVYFALLGDGQARWLYVLLLGIAPGGLVLFFDLSMGVLALVCGAAVAPLTHLMCRSLGPDFPIDTKTLDGSA